jgi:metal-sulfur cluster biosynthetic enzyme
MNSEIQNANPTIRAASDLPTRQRRASPSSGKKNYALGIFHNSIPSSTYLTDPFESQAGSSDSELDEDELEPIDEQEIYDLISTISDPEHPLSLGSLAVVNLPDIHIKPLGRNLQVVTVEITPTITHCSLATLIGLGVRVRLEKSLPPRFRIDVRVKEGTHSTGDQVNKQLGDKERVAAALENQQLANVLRKMLETCQ